MRPAAELARDVLHLDHSHLFAVLLPEERHRAEFLRPRSRRVQSADGVVTGDPAIHQVLDVGELLGRKRLAVGEVEPQLVGPHGRTRLPHVCPEPPAKRGVEKMRGGVVAGCRMPKPAVHDKARPLALLELAALDRGRNRLVVAEAVDVFYSREARLGLDRARIRHLPATLGVEGALGKFH